MSLKEKLIFVYYLLSFPIIYGIYALNYKALQMHQINYALLALAIISIIYIAIFGKNWVLFHKIRISKRIFFLFVGLVILFAINNYFMMQYGDANYWNSKYKETSIALILMHYIFSSTSEEIIYRGFIQNYTNSITINQNSAITKGNWVATILMTFMHFGFFFVFDFFFAITSIVLVFIFSLVNGYIMDKTKNLFLPIVIHIIVNFVHYAICLFLIYP